MNPTKIPAELTDRKRWAVFLIGPEVNPSTQKPVKRPLMAGTTDTLASVSDPDTWATFDAVMEHITTTGVGWPAYVLKKEDGIVFLDTDAGTPDETVEELLTVFPTAYVERSSSEKGAHFIMKGTLSSHGCRSGCVEIYAHNRFCIFTGDVIDGRLTIGEANAKDLADVELQLTSGKVQLNGDLPDAPETISDDDALAWCERHSKEGKFKSLYHEGNWQQWQYPSQSEADHALIGMIAGATRNNEQAQRLWNRSRLYRAVKQHIFKFSIRRVRARQMKEEEDEKWAAEFTKVKPKVAAKKEISPLSDNLFESIPKGLFAELYRAHLDKMTYQVRETALVATFVTVAALFQRKFCTAADTALNLWVFLLGSAGVGKNPINTGPVQLFRAADININSFMVGELKSAAAVEDYLRHSPRLIAYHAECAGWIKNMCDVHAHAIPRTLRECLTNSYTFARSVMPPRGLSLKKEKGKDNASRENSIERPCLTLYGESVPEFFYDAVGVNQVNSGFIPRFSIVEIDERKAPRKIGPRIPFSKDLLERIKALAEDADMFDAISTDAVLVPMQEKVWDSFTVLQENLREQYLSREGASNQTLRQTILTRSAEKIVKVATYMAVCADQKNPMVSQEHLDWAIRFVTETDNRMIQHLCSGEFDGAAHQQLKVMRSIFTRAYNMSAAKRTKNGFNTEAVQNAPEIVPYGWLLSQAKVLATFKNARDVSQAVNRCLKDLQDCGEIMEILNQEQIAKYGVRGRLFRNISVGMSDSED